MTPFERKELPWLIGTAIVTLLLIGLGLVLVGRWIASNFRYPSRPAFLPPLKFRSATEEASHLLGDKFLKVDTTLRMIDDGKLDHLFRNDETKARIRAHLHQAWGWLRTEKLRAESGLKESS